MTPDMAANGMSLDVFVSFGVFIDWWKRVLILSSPLHFIKDKLE